MNHSDPGSSSQVSSIAQGPSGFIRRTLQAFHYKDFRLMWFGAFTSTTGTWMQTVAQSWLVLALTNSAFYLGLTQFLGELPFLLFTLIGGVFADRVDRRKMLLGSQYTQMTCAFLLAFLVFTGWIQVWHFLALAFVAGTGQSFGAPAYSALIPGLVDRKDVPNAIALNSIQFNLARAVGPVLAAFALTYGGSMFCFLANGISFTAVIVSLYLIQVTFAPPKTEESVLEGMRMGFRFLKKQGALWQLSVLGFASTFCGIPVWTLLPVFARDIFDKGAAGYSTMVSIAGAGAVCGALFLCKRFPNEKTRKVHPPGPVDFRPPGGPLFPFQKPDQQLPPFCFWPESA